MTEFFLINPHHTIFMMYIPDWKNVVAKNYKPWTMRFQGFMGIRSLAKQIQSSFDKSLHCHEMLVRMQIPRVLCLRHARCCLFLSSKNAFRSYIMIFKCALAIWLRSLTVQISHVSSTGEVVSRKYWKPFYAFLNTSSRKAS